MKSDRRWLACVVGVLILGGVYADHSTLHAFSKNAENYHSNVYGVGKQIPMMVGEWLGTNNDLPAGAVSLLRPNFTLARDYSNTAGQRASFLLIQCKDARDLLGHYPPVCYTAHGFVQVSTERRDWTVDGDVLQGTMYEFSRTDRQNRTSAIKVYDVMVLPNGQTAPDMTGVDRVARHREQRYYGAAQIQILTDAAMPEADRTQVISLLLRGAKPAIDAIRAGVRHEP